MKATKDNGVLRPIENCYISIPGYGKITMRTLPDISDSKSASYSDEPVIGRSFPMKTYSHSENRAISWTAYFLVCEKSDIQKNIKEMRAIQSAVYPRKGGSGAPYAPPPVCALRCGNLLSQDTVCAILRSYTVKFPTDTVWDEETNLPYKFSVDMSWELVYMSSKLPGQDQIINYGA